MRYDSPSHGCTREGLFDKVVFNEPEQVYFVYAWWYNHQSTDLIRNPEPWKLKRPTFIRLKKKYYIRFNKPKTLVFMKKDK